MVRSPEPGRSARHQRRHGDRRETRSFAEEAVELRRREICAGLLQDLIGGAKLPHLAFQFLDPVPLRARQPTALSAVNLEQDDLPRHRKTFEERKAKFATDSIGTIQADANAYAERLKNMESGLNAILAKLTMMPCLSPFRSGLARR